MDEEASTNRQGSAARIAIAIGTVLFVFSRKTRMSRTSYGTVVSKS